MTPLSGPLPAIRDANSRKHLFESALSAPFPIPYSRSTYSYVGFGSLWLLIWA